MSKKIHNLEEAYDHILSELICIDCKERFMDVRPLKTWLKDLECPKCNKRGYLIETGEVISNGYYEKVVKENPDYKIYRYYSQIYQWGD